MLYKYIYKNELGEEINFSPFGEIIALKVEGINGHEIDVSSTKGINQIGDSVTSVTVNSKPITIDGVLRGNLEHNRKTLLNIIRPQIKGVMYAINDNEEVFKIDVVCKNTPIVGFGLNTMPFQLSFYAAYPYWKKEDSESVDIRKLVALFRFPRNFSGTWKFSEYQRSEFINVENNGNENTSLKIVYTAKTIASNPKLLNVETGEYIKLNYTFAAGETVTITTGYNNKKIISSTKGNIFRNLDLINSTFLQLKPGKNIFKFTADTNESNVDVVVYYEEVVSSI